MATVSGSLLFDVNRLNIPAGLPGIANVPIVLQNTNTEEMAVALTDAAGGYSFINVPPGSYRIVEAYGTPGGVPSPADFNNATPAGVPLAQFPPISFVTNPPSVATNLDCITPNTILITVGDTDVTNQNILNGPVTYSPISALLDSCSEIISGNLITDADNGTFGFYPPGTPANTGDPAPPYPELTPDFTYVVPGPGQSIPDDSEYTVQNIMNDNYNNTGYAAEGTWWRIADHDTGNETGRFMLVNGYRFNSVFFTTTVPVSPNTHYLFSAWILNVFKITVGPVPIALPALGFRIIGSNTGPLYDASLGIEIPTRTDVPEWKQIGTDIYTGDNTEITINFVSEGEEGIGNDYAVDDIELTELEVPTFVPVKTVNTNEAVVGQIVTYTITLNNNCDNPLLNLFFRDILTPPLTFVPGSVTVDGVSQAALNPETGIQLDGVEGGGQTVITFMAEVSTAPSENPIPNTATLSYEYTPVTGGIVSEFEEDSNTVYVTVVSAEDSADLSVNKTASANPIAPGEVLTYTVTVRNLGPATAVNTVLSDIIPPGILNPEYSIDGGVTFLPWEGNLSLGDLALDEITTVLIVGTVADDAGSPLTNTATVTSDTHDPNTDNNTSTISVRVGEVTARCQAVTDVMQSTALQDAAATHILNAEGEKIQRIVAMFEAGEATAEQVTAVNDSVTALAEAINVLELVIQAKVKLLAERFEECGI